MWDFPANPSLYQLFTPPGSRVVYKYNGYAWVTDQGVPDAPLEFVLKAGDTMTGFLTLSADPTAPMHAATKQYSDTRALPLGGNIGDALVRDASNVPSWGYPIDDGTF